jgi:hypothetical protein
MYKKGVVLPSGLMDRPKEERISYFNRKYQNTPLRMGCIVKIHEVDDKTNVSKLFVEYDVVTDEQKVTLGQSFTTYPNCIALDSLGGLADFFEAKLRVSKDEKFEKSYDFKKQDGTMVLILCIDGFSDKPIIIGGVGHQARKTNLTKNNELHLEGEYNGMNWRVNKDGELKITFKSKTDNKGKPQDEKAGGTFFEINKKGSVDINTNLEGDDETYMRMDKENKDVGLKAGANIGLTAKKNIELTAEADIKGAAKANVEFAAEGSAKYSSKSAFDIMSDAKVNIKGASINVEADGNYKLKASNVIVSSPNIKLGDAALPALIPSTLFLGISPFFGLPVISTAIGPYSGSVLISS